MIRVFEAFAGYGSQSLALKRLKENYKNFDYSIVGYSEIEENAINIYNKLHSEESPKNYGDISKVNWKDVEDFDLFTYSFPCTDISFCGASKGFKKGSGTRSSLLWECERAITEKRPKYLLMENVAALLSKRYINDYKQWLKILDNLGYVTYTSILNAKDYGIPQSRKRAFSVSILKENENDYPQYVFPFKVKKRDIVDFLDTNVDEKYYVNPNRYGFDDVKDYIPTEIKKMYVKNTDKDGNVSCIRASYFKQGVANFLNHDNDGYKACCVIVVGNKGVLGKRMIEKGYNIPQEFANELINIRKLTPSETSRLMGLRDDEIKEFFSIADSHIYKLNGNSIVVDVLYYIFKNLFAK